MALSYDYDETSETWPFFLLTVLLVALVPLTVLQVVNLCKNSDNDAATVAKKPTGKGESGDSKGNEESLETLNEQYTSSSILKFRHKFTSSRSKLFHWKTLFIVVGWILVAVLVQRISNNESITNSDTTNIFDPYELLGISASSNDKTIKSAYRKLSLKYHPDKLPKDLTEEEKTAMENTFVQITKAYESLTDEIVRENYLKYGHPDGPQPTSHGIALPSFLVDSTSSPILVILYILSFVLVLPLMVSKWWSRTQSHTKKGIHTKTASYFVDRLVNYKPSEVVTVELIVNWISNAQEFKDFYPNLNPSDFENLILDHINRREIGNTMENSQQQLDIQYRIVAKCHTLLYGLLDIACGFRNTDVAIMTINTFKCIVQAVPYVKNSEILQLPNIDKEVLNNGTVDEIHTLGKLFTFETNKIGQILGIKDETKLSETLKVASNIPFLKVLKSEFVVAGEEFVTPESLPHISIKVLVRSAKHKSIPVEKFPKELLAESDEWQDLQDPFNKMNEQPYLPYSFAPRFPTKRRNAWCCLVGLQKDGKLIQSPFILEKLSLKNLEKEDFDKLAIKDLDTHFNVDDWEIGTIKIPVGQQAPKQNGNFYFRVIIKSTDYFGPDLDMTMVMSVRDPPKFDDSLTYDMGSDSDSDDDENDDKNDDEDEDYSDYTDIDTDTEVEEDAVN